MQEFLRTVALTPIAATARRLDEKNPQPSNYQTVAGFYFSAISRLDC
jgi:CBS domain containing-hemolysin-like protein